MASFPSSIDSFAGFTSTHTLQADNHAAQHNLEQGAIVAVETKVGTGNSTPTNNTVLRGNGTGTTTYDQVHLATDVSGILGTANGGTGSSTITGSGLPVFQTSPIINSPTESGGTYNTATLTQPTISDFTNSQHNHQNAAGGGTLNAASAIQNTTITSNKLNLTNAGVDANGWTKRDYGTWQEYEQVLTTGASGITVNANTNSAALGGTISIPVGITDSSSLRFYVGTIGGFGGRIFASIDNGNVVTAVTSFSVYLGNLTTGNIIFKGFVYLRAVTV